MNDTQESQRQHAPPASKHAAVDVGGAARTQRAVLALSSLRREFEALAPKLDPIILAVLEWPVDLDADDRTTPQLPRDFRHRESRACSRHWRRGLGWARANYLFVHKPLLGGARAEGDTLWPLLDRLGRVYHMYSPRVVNPLVDDNADWREWANAVVDRVSPDQRYTWDDEGHQRTLLEPRCEKIRQCTVYEDVAVASLQAIDSLTQEAERSLSASNRSGEEGKGKAKHAAIKPIKIPPGTKWHQISVRVECDVIHAFLPSGGHVQITPERMGLVNRRRLGCPPNADWRFLLACIEAKRNPPRVRGTADVAAGADLRSKGVGTGGASRKACNVRKALRALFPVVEGDPLPNRRSHGWPPAFSIKP